MRRAVTFVVGLCLASASLAAPGGVKVAPPPPPYVGAYQPRGVDEIGLWKENDEDERVLATSPMVIRDEALNTYVKGVLCSAVGDDRCKSTRIYILRTPVFNANMSPNGTMRVFTGLLLRMHNEAELAEVLAHEFGHFELRHTLARFKAQRSATDLLSWAAVFAAMSNSYSARSNFDSLQLSVYGRLYRFNRDEERQADVFGIGFLNASKLRPQAAANVWRNSMAEATASASARGLPRPKFDQIAFFATHPPDAEREMTLSALALPEGRTREDGTDRYQRAMATWLPLFLDDQIKLNDFGGSDFLINALAEGGWTASLWLARGDLYRARGNPRDLVNAAEFYTNAVGLNPGLAEAHRGLGLSLLKTGRQSDGQAELARYLQLKPDASDAAMIRMLAPSNGNDR